MIFNYQNVTRRVGRCLILGVGLLMLAANSAAETNLLDHFSFDDCDPFEARALIMEVHGKKSQFVAAEETIYVMNATFDDQPLITELTDADGNRMDFSSFQTGEWVYVKGFKHMDGGVVASLVQKIDAPERDAPLLRKIIKKSRRYKRTPSSAAVLQRQ
jgi:hypothetical protein